MYGNLFNAFFIDFKDVYFHIPVVKYHHSLQFVWQNMSCISGKFYHLGWPWPVGLLLPSLNISCSLADAKVSVLLSI